MQLRDFLLREPHRDRHVASDLDGLKETLQSRGLKDTFVLVEPIILASGRKHGVPDEDILHAYRNPLRIIDQPDVTVLIGPAIDGNLLEVGLIEAEDFNGLFVIHAMPARNKYLR